VEFTLAAIFSATLASDLCFDIKLKKRDRAET